MPPIIRSKRAQVTDEAVDWAKEFWKTAYSNMKATLEATNVRQRQELEFELEPAMARIRGAFQNPALMDAQITSLRSLPYTHLDAKVLRVDTQTSLNFLIARTKTVIIRDGGPYDMGNYTVYLPMTILKQGVGSGYVHFVPERDPKTYARTPHHTWHPNSSQDEPWMGQSSTCWGGFSNMIVRIVRDGDLVDLLRNIYIYLSRFDRGSTLTSITNCRHARSISRAAATEITANE